MEWPLVKSFLWALVLFVQIHGHRGCIEEERIGLLELKAFMKSKTNYSNYFLQSRVNETKSECCNILCKFVFEKYYTYIITYLL